MTARGRIEAALQHREPDRTPVFEYVLLSPVADALLGRRYSGDPANLAGVIEEKGWHDAVRQVAIDRLDLALRLGHDMLYVTPVPPPQSPRPSPSPADTTPLPDDPVERVRRRTAAATPPAAPGDAYFQVYDCLKEEMIRRDVDLPILAPAYAHGVWTDVDLMQTMLLAPEVGHAHFTLATERALLLVEGYLRCGIDQVGVGGDFAGNRPLISPDAYKTFIVPQVRGLSRRIHSAGAYAVNASDGDLWSVIDDFVVGCEVDGYLEIDMHAGMDMRRLKASHGDRVTL